MTREELDEWNVCLERPDARVMKDVIFDYFEQKLLNFESKTCESCKCLQKRGNDLVCSKTLSFVNTTKYIEIKDLSFGCNKHEPKDN